MRFKLTYFFTVLYLSSKVSPIQYLLIEVLSPTSICRARLCHPPVFVERGSVTHLYLLSEVLSPTCIC